MIIGIDFDNTIVCYDKLFYEVALEKDIIPEDLSEVKGEVRDYLRKEGKEDAWTKLQGYVYGPGILGAKPFEGILDFFMYCKQHNIPVFIISHKTLHPVLGPKYNLHEAAQKWLEKNGFYDAAGIDFHKENVFFELTKEEKLDRIAKQKCTLYIDDLPEFLAEPEFPKSVRKILFDSNNKYKDKNFECAKSWKEIINKIKSKDSFEFGKILFDLSKNANLPTDFSVERVENGNNNQVFYVAYKDGTKALLKAYFQHPNDPRNRLKSEFSFVNFAWKNNIRSVPKPIVADFWNNLGLYEFIDGNKISLADVDDVMVKKALEFFNHLNEYKESAEAKDLPVASEACFSIRDHIKIVKNRVEKLKKIERNSKIDEEAADFVENELFKMWNNILHYATDYANEHGLDVGKEISEEEKCISPSDFGFHNAIIRNEKLYFIDFEYAGIDDIAKMVCDFFCQPEIPVPFKYFDFFVDEISKNFLNNEELRHRINLLLPVYRIKWCCILMNDFLDVGAKRRGFAHGEISEHHKARQLDKARKYLDYVQLKKTKNIKKSL